MKFRKIIRWLAAAGFGAVAVWWLAAGRNPGWTKTQVAVEKIEEITGIPEVVYEDRFVPGVDILGVAGTTALVLMGLTLLGKRRGQSPEQA
ncbi:MAG: hypothetical protein JWL81_1750 [Verrucomicrobiales bacterium]|nr:hypothetical protein [Verrucomicrobiales bacterium]